MKQILAAGIVLQIRYILVICGKCLFFLLSVLSLFISPALALFTGIVYALVIGNSFVTLSKKISKYLLQVAVVGLGFGMNLYASLQAGKEGILFTIISVSAVMLIGCFVGKKLGVLPRLSYLISAGTAICGGSAIAATAPVVKANDNETSIALAVIFTLNAIALFIFPPIGRLLSLDQSQFGLWAAIAIHDTSSVVGAASAYGSEALKTAVTVKLTRALWIIPLSLVSMFIFKNAQSDNTIGGSAASACSKNSSSKTKIYIPWFIFFFIIAMLINTFLPIQANLLNIINVVSHKSLSLTLFLIGCTLSLAAIKKVGIKPLLLALILWLLISLLSLGVVMI